MTTAGIRFSNRTATKREQTPVARAALIAGIGLLLMVLTAPFAELYVFPRLVVSGNAAETTNNIIENQMLFSAALFGYLITFVCDLVVAWALYSFLKPVNKDLSLLTALFRLVYTVIALVALLNLVTVVRMLNALEVGTTFPSGQLPDQIMLSLSTFRSHWYFGLLFFGIHLGLLGYLVFKSRYVPKILGVFLIVAGIGYLLTSLRPFLFPYLTMDFAEYTFYGELIFMLWLLLKGSRLKESNL
jgi:hypothetical protein